MDDQDEDEEEDSQEDSIIKSDSEFTANQPN